MIRRKPTKIELKASDIEELEQKKQEWAGKVDGGVSQRVGVAQERKSKTERINERIGYDPSSVADDGNPHIPLRRP